jgi:hypothetical protein
MSHATERTDYQKLQDIADRVDAEEGIRQDLEDAKKGKLRPVREFFAEFEAKHGIRKRRSRPSRGSGEALAAT